MSTLTDTHVIDTLDRYNLLRLGEDPTPDRDLNDWDTYPYDIANSGTSDNEVVTNTETRTYRPNWERVRRQITSRKREFLPPVDDVDALAWYLPIHFYGPEWGIYVREDAIEMLAGYIYDRLPAPTGSISETEQLFQAAAWVLYLHEAFHHKAESFAIRLEIARLQPVYIPYFNNVYRAARGTDHQIEEIVATNEMYRRLHEPTYRKRLGPGVYNATRRFLSEWIPTLGPSYRLGTCFGSDRRLNELCCQISEGRQHPSQPIDDWDVVPQMTRGLFTKETVVYMLAPRALASELG